jgi:hypothetical protein
VKRALFILIFSGLFLMFFAISEYSDEDVHFHSEGYIAGYFSKAEIRKSLDDLEQFRLLHVLLGLTVLVISYCSSSRRFTSLAFLKNDSSNTL